MRKILFLELHGGFFWLAVLTAMLFIVAGCGGSENGSKVKTTEKKTDLTLAELVGTYRLSEFSQIDTSNGNSVDQNSAENWSGRMVITSAGEIHFTMTLNNEDSSFVWTIIEVQNESIQLKDSSCKEWADISLNGNQFTIIWPEGECSEKYIWTWSFVKISCSGDLTPSDPDDSGQNSGAGVTLTDLVGTYDLSGFSMTDTNDGFSFDQNNFSTWSGQMAINAQGRMQLTQVIEQKVYSFLWDILAIEKKALQVREADCVQWIDMVYNKNNLTLTWPAGACLENLTATYRFAKTNTKTIMSLQNYAPRFQAAINKNINTLPELFEALRN